MQTQDHAPRATGPSPLHVAATLASAVGAALASWVCCPSMLGGCVVGAVLLGMLHAFTHDIEGGPTDSAPLWGTITGIILVLGIGLAQVEVHALPLATVALVAQATWLAIFLGLQRA